MILLFMTMPDATYTELWKAVMKRWDCAERTAKWNIHLATEFGYLSATDGRYRVTDKALRQFEYPRFPKGPEGWQWADFTRKKPNQYFTDRAYGRAEYERSMGR